MPPALPWWRRAAPFLLIPAVLILLVLGLFAGLDPAALLPQVERSLSRSAGREVRIGAIRRLDHSPFHATIALERVAVAQPGWIGRGNMVEVRAATVHLRLLPLLIGRASPDRVEISGLDVALVRHDTAHANWTGAPGSGGSKRGGLTKLIIRDGIVTLDDRKRDHRLRASLSADERGFRLIGQGSLAGSPATLSVRGAPVSRPGEWPFTVTYRSARANFDLAGRADHPLDLGHYSVTARAWGPDLADLDRIIEAGLPGTQPVTISAFVRHDRPDWDIRRLKARIGRSDVNLKMTVKKREGRTILNGDFTSAGFDFADLASQAGRARAAAKRAALGPHVVPDTAIDLARLSETDGTLRYSIARVLGTDPMTISALTGTLKLDHRLLTAEPLSLRLPSGTVAGTAQVDHRRGSPKLTLDLRLGGARLEGLLTHADTATGSLAAHARLTGTGATVRAAIGRASGSMAMVAQDGTIGRRAALFLGSDLGRAFFEGSEDRTPLHCLVARFEARGGTARPHPLLIDTGVARIDGSGTIDLASEGLALRLDGHPKLRHAVSLDQPIGISGTLSHPVVVPPRIEKTLGTAVKLLGRLIAGEGQPPATDADCASAAAAALR